MNERIAIRVSCEQKKRLIEKAGELGYRSYSDLARHLIEKGIENISLKESEYHMLSHTTQSVKLLREILSALTANEDLSKNIIHEIREDSLEWVKFSKHVSK